MKRTREELIRAGRVWQVYPDNKPEDIKFEGSHSACVRWLKTNRLWRAWRTGGGIRLGRLIYETPA